MKNGINTVVGSKNFTRSRATISQSWKSPELPGLPLFLTGQLKEELSSLRSQLIGMMEYWNNGFWKIGGVEDWKFLKTVLIISYKHDKIPML
jgi:hypothetical protein